MELTVVREIEIRFRGRGRRSPAQVSNPAAAARFFRGLIGTDVREKFLAVYLDGRNRPMGWRVVSIGTASASLVHPRETFQAAVRLGASGVIVAHNHPSGNPNPSGEDIVLTERLARAGDIMGIKLVDHIVLGAGTFVSLRDRRPAIFAAREC
jgi:DNA repair protein RadC